MSGTVAEWGVGLAGFAISISTFVLIILTYMNSQKLLNE